MVLTNAIAGHVETFDDFTARRGPAVALDGFVEGPSKFTGRHVNFNHHEGVDRFSTRATCEQVAAAISSGLMPRLGDGVEVWVNDADPDVALSVWLLNHPERANEARTSHLVHIEGLVDTLAGCWLPTDEVELAELAWVSEPWARRRGDGPSDAAGLLDVIAETASRIDAYADGRSGRCACSDHLEVVERVGRIAVVREHGPMARPQLAASGVDVFASLRPRTDGSADVTVCTTGPMSGVDLCELWPQLNAVDGIAAGTDRWGGGDVVGGSPRQAGTRLLPSQLLDLLCEFTRSN